MSFSVPQTAENHTMEDIVKSENYDIDLDIERQRKRRRTHSASPQPQLCAHIASPLQNIAEKEKELEVKAKESADLVTLPYIDPTAPAQPMNAAEVQLRDGKTGKVEEMSWKSDQQGLPTPPITTTQTTLPPQSDDVEMMEHSTAIDSLLSTEPVSTFAQETSGQESAIITTHQSTEENDNAFPLQPKANANGKIQGGKGKRMVNSSRKNASGSTVGKKGKGKTKASESLESRSVTPDPSSLGAYISPSGTLSDPNAVYCICQRSYSDEEEGLMVGCESCDGWFHASCVGLDEEMVDLLDVYICKSCERNTHQRTIYKAVCKRDECKKSVAGSNSKHVFCSPHCAFRYSQALLKIITNKNAIKQLTKALAPYPEPDVGITVIHHRPAPVLKETSFPNYDQTDHQLYHIQSRIVEIERLMRFIQKRKALFQYVVDRCDQLPPLTVTKSDEVQHKSKSSKKKGSRPADDRPCGWDARLITADEQVDQFVKGDEGETMRVEWEDIEVCMAGKRRCDRHQGWQKTIGVSLDIELATLTRTFNSLVENQRLLEEGRELLRLSKQARDEFLAKRQVKKYN
nr:hypothetical protein L204_04623 [Cryptococcus depauperatus CBS 7855]